MGRATDQTTDRAFGRAMGRTTGRRLGRLQGQPQRQVSPSRRSRSPYPPASACLRGEPQTPPRQRGHPPGRYPTRSRPWLRAWARRRSGGPARRPRRCQRAPRGRRAPPGRPVTGAPAPAPRAAAPRDGRRAPRRAAAAGRARADQACRGLAVRPVANQEPQWHVRVQARAGRPRQRVVGRERWSCADRRQHFRPSSAQSADLWTVGSPGDPVDGDNPRSSTGGGLTAAEGHPAATVTPPPRRARDPHAHRPPHRPLPRRPR
jgi:hypothetical protein